MTNGTRKVVVPRNNPVNAITMAGIVIAPASPSMNFVAFSNGLTSKPALFSAR